MSRLLAGLILGLLPWVASVMAADASAVPDDTMVIEYQGKRYRLSIEPPAPGQTLLRAEMHEVRDDSLASIRVTPATGEPAPARVPLNAPVLAAIVLLVAAVTGTLLYFLVIQPRLRRRPLLHAFQIIADDETSSFEQAEAILEESLTVGLRAADIAEARFALAYVRARLGQYEEAVEPLAARITKRKPDAASIYLMLWLRHRLKQWEEIEQLHNEHADLVGDMLDAKLIVAIAFLHLARNFWSRRQVDAALHYFTLLRKLNLLTEEIPSNIDQHEIVLGIMLLFDRKVEEAIGHFEGAMKTAGDSGPALVQARLGILACQWRQAVRPDIDKELGEVVSRMHAAAQSGGTKTVPTSCPHCRHAYIARESLMKQTAVCHECGRAFVAVPDAAAKSKDKDAKREMLLGEDGQLFRDAALWHAVSLATLWKSLPEQRPLPAGQRQVMARRLSLVRQIDPQIPDPDLMQGLLDFWLAENDDQREAAVAVLQKVHERGVYLPELLQLLESWRRANPPAERVMSVFLSLLRAYMSNTAISEQRRRSLLNRMVRHEVAKKKLGKIDIAADVDAAPTLQEVRDRVAISSVRLPRLINAARGKLGPEAINSIQKLSACLEEKSQALAKTAEELEATEQDLMGTAGEFLLRDEEPASAKGSTGGNRAK